MGRPEYLSKTYYDVVIRDGNYLGWYTVFVGCGSMTFRHPDHGDKKFSEKSGSGAISWMQDCWDQFIDYVNKINLAKG